MIIVLDSAANEQVVCVDALIMYRSKKKFKRRGKNEQYITVRQQQNPRRVGHLIAEPASEEKAYSPWCPLVSKPLPKGSGTGIAGGLNIWADWCEGNCCCCAYDD